MMQLRDHGPS